MVMGVISTTVMVIGAAPGSPWPWWLTVAQGAVAALCFTVGLELIERVTGTEEAPE
jgi:hypothetical protein